MKQIMAVFFLLITINFYSSCAIDYFGFSEEELDSENVQFSEPMAYCNKFNTDGFKGIVTAHYDFDTDRFNTNVARLYLWNVPYEFAYPPINYIQVHSFNIRNNKEVFNKTPITMKIIAGAGSATLARLSTIGHDFLDEMNIDSIDDLIQTHSFILEDIAGWDGVNISIFGGDNKPIKVAQILIPPFEANPNNYLERHNREKRLLRLHPFQKLLDINDTGTDQVFYDKARAFCENAPVRFEVPPYEEQFAKGGEVDIVDQLIEDLSFLPSVE